MTESDESDNLVVLEVDVLNPAANFRPSVAQFFRKPTGEIQMFVRTHGFYDYLLQRSPDLLRWENLGEKIPGVRSGH